MVGLVGAAQVVHRVTGLPGFFQGLTARVLYQAPSTAVSWSVYEAFKYYLKSRQEPDENSKSSDYDTIKDMERRTQRSLDSALRPIQEVLPTVAAAEE